MRKGFTVLLILAALAGAAVYSLYWLLFGGSGGAAPLRLPDRVERNYGAQIEAAAAKYSLDPAFLKALCFLECSGHSPAARRFEPKVYRQLQRLQKREISRYEHVTPEMIADASDAALRNLASSWGPFQLMGYKCLQVDVKVADLRGADAVDWAARWIDLTYGSYVRKGRYADAFHLHNTGHPMPASGRPFTHDPQYVPRGLERMEMYRTP